MGKTKSNVSSVSITGGRKYHVISQDASLVLGILAEEEGHAIALVVTQVHVDGRWDRQAQGCIACHRSNQNM